MLKIFRKSRINLLFKSKIGRYFIYGLGEIILVVAGILIALYLNNRNDVAKQNNRFEKIKLVVKSNIQDDLESLEETIHEYEVLDSLIVNVLSNPYSKSFIDSLEKKDLKNCQTCRPLNVYFMPFHPKNDGYVMLKSIGELHSEKQNSINNDILLFYKQSKESIDLPQNLLTELVMNNILDLESYDWYIPCLEKTFNRDAMEYLFESVKYKNKLVTFQIIAISNFMTRLKEYKENGAELLKKLN